MGFAAILQVVQASSHCWLFYFGVYKDGRQLVEAPQAVIPAFGKGYTKKSQRVSAHSFRDALRPQTVPQSSIGLSWGW